MKKVLLLSLLIIYLAQGTALTGQKIVILHTNDLHSRLTGFAPELDYTPLSVNNDKTVGGFARIASILENERAGDKGITLVVDAGDFLMSHVLRVRHRTRLVGGQGVTAAAAPEVALPALAKTLRRARSR